ncbi:hypothetical protein [Pseudoalteromonas luteoviolacea]|uniref:Uncharacterized protein n=1 Tax=Pseudoalteromonas luteoviolacea H33 TaxID=1365251 RepID=A0A167F6H8_9GAMM|nr:hypothetical protein [Pseudoalteromonas luteoviolacea]KZN51753.1 hypothetical protein N476_11970 [Pseudoalteromonas luteoviolacea H33]KZN72758.1 hypothetical protein N477_24510 [Pseudoalteromonas luteoviolacea H33-S]
MLRVGFGVVLFCWGMMAYANTSHPLAACMSLHEIAASTLEQKSLGQPKQVLLARLSPKQVLAQSEMTNPADIIAFNMHEIIDEVYDFPPLPMNIYGQYVVEKCIRRVDNLPIASYELIHPKLQQCMKSVSRRAIADCVTDVLVNTQQHQ